MFELDWTEEGNKMATKKVTRKKTNKGKVLRKAKKLEATKPLEYYKIHIEE